MTITLSTCKIVKSIQQSFPNTYHEEQYLNLNDNSVSKKLYVLIGHTGVYKNISINFKKRLEG